MSIEEKQNSPTYLDFENIEYPQSEREVSNFIKKNYKSNTPIEITGSGSKRKMGRKIQCGATLSLSKLNGIVEYFPEELYIKVKAGTRIKKIEEELKKNNQQLAFEPIDFGYFLNGKSDYGTAAGQVACNISGSRRFKVGSIRDHVLGFRGVNGRGEIIKSGGVVVKNVTGYDLSKLMCGSHGTLVALTEITFKVLPTPEASKTLIIHNQKTELAIHFLEKSVSSSSDVSGAVFFPNDLKIPGCITNIENTFKLNDLKHEGSITAIRIEGSKNSINQRIENLINELQIANIQLARECTEQGRKLRARKTSAASSAGEQQRQKLRELVGEHFDIRQKMRERELAKLENRIRELRRTLDQRNGSRTALIEKRFLQLTSEPNTAAW